MEMEEKITLIDIQMEPNEIFYRTDTIENDYGEITSLEEYDKWAARQRELVAKRFEPKPEPCPFCGGDEIILLQFPGDVLKGDFLNLCMYKCKSCRTYGPAGINKTEALRLWNQRGEA